MHQKNCTLHTLIFNLNFVHVTPEIRSVCLFYSTGRFSNIETNKQLFGFYLYIYFKIY